MDNFKSKDKTRLRFRKLSRTLWAFLCFILIMLSGCLFHFLYEISAKNPAVVFFAPVNESIFEHIKLMELNIYLIFFFLPPTKSNYTTAEVKLTRALFAMIFGMSSMVLFYYFLDYGLSVSGTISHIAVFVLSAACSISAGFHCDKHGFGLRGKVSLWLAILIIISIGLLSFFPPKLPLFYDFTKGIYGIP